MQYSCYYLVNRKGYRISECFKHYFPYHKEKNMYKTLENNGKCYAKSGSWQKFAKSNLTKKSYEHLKTFREKLCN